MAGFNPYHVDEIITEASAQSNLFGLIVDSENNHPEMHGYEVTMSGELVLPELRQKKERENLKANWTIF